MGGSGCGKTTILRLIGGQLRQQSGTVLVDGQSVRDLSRDELFALRRRIGMLFQFGALFTDMTVFENVAFPMREHTDLAEPLIRDLVLMKLHAVGLRGAAQLQPVGAVRRHGAARGARARDRARSDARDVRRAVRRTRSDFARRRRAADPQAERCARHHVGGGHARRVRVAEDRRLSVFRVGGPHHRAGHARRGAHIRPIPSCASSSTAQPDGPVPFHYPARPYAEELAARAR